MSITPKYEWHYLHSLIPMDETECYLYTDVEKNTVIEGKWNPKKWGFYDKENKLVEKVLMWSYKNIK
jgi:hypothetical protein